MKRALANKSRLLTTDVPFDPRRDKDNVHSTLSRAGWRGRNRRPRPVVLLARFTSLCQQKEARRGDRVAESLVRLDISRLGLGPGLGVRTRPQRSPSISARAAGT